MSQESSGFWSSLQGILTGLAAVITAITGLYIAINGGENNAPVVVDNPTPVTQVQESSNSVQTSNIERNSGPNNQSSLVVANQKGTIKGLSSFVNCEQFPTVNTIKSLLGWSNHYHQKIIDANGVKRRALPACKKTISYRAQAYCKAPDNLEAKTALNETLTLCRDASVTIGDLAFQ